MGQMLWALHLLFITSVHTLLPNATLLYVGVGCVKSSLFCVSELKELS